MLKPPLAVIVPVYNEAGNIEALAEEAVGALGDDFALELVLVDDGSDDGTGDALARLADRHEAITIITHPKRSGKSAALRTGMLAAMAKEVDLTTVGAVGLVAGVRRNRTDGGSRKTASRLANGLRRQLLNDDCPDTACGLKLIPRDLFLVLPFFDALHRYLPALVGHLGFEIRYTPVTNRPRISGQSKYTNLGRAAAGLFDLMGVIWMMRRTSVPDRRLLLAHAFKQKSSAAR